MRTIDADAIIPRIKWLIEAERQIYKKASWDFAEKCLIVVESSPTVSTEPEWIPCSERLPEQGKRYLVIRFDEVTKTQFIDILWHDAHDLWWNRLYKGRYNVTHWMPLPEPPKEES